MDDRVSHSYHTGLIDDDAELQPADSDGDGVDADDADFDEHEDDSNGFALDGRNIELDGSAWLLSNFGLAGYFGASRIPLATTEAQVGLQGKDFGSVSGNVSGLTNFCRILRDLKICGFGIVNGRIPDLVCW